MDVREREGSVVSHTHPDGGSNPQPFGVRDYVPTNSATRPEPDVFIIIKSLEIIGIILKNRKSKGKNGCSEDSTHSGYGSPCPPRIRAPWLGVGVKHGWSRAPRQVSWEDPRHEGSPTRSGPAPPARPAQRQREKEELQILPPCKKAKVTVPANRLLCTLHRSRTRSLLRVLFSAALSAQRVSDPFISVPLLPTLERPIRV